MTWLLSRLPLVLLVTGVAIVLGPFPGQVGLNAGAGVGLAGVVLAIERAVRDVPGTRVLGGVGGALAKPGLAAGDGLDAGQDLVELGALCARQAPADSLDVTRDQVEERRLVRRAATSVAEGGAEEPVVGVPWSQDQGHRLMPSGGRDVGDPRR